MFKAKNKKIILLYIIISVALSVTRIFGSFLPIDLGLQKLATINRDPITKINKSASAGDLFLSLYDHNTSSPEGSAFMSTINEITKDIANQSKSCQVTINDIVVILMQKVEFRKDMYNNNDIPLSTTLTLSGSVPESCNKVLYCLGGEKEYSIDTRKEIENCQSIIYSKYKIKKTLGSKYISQPGSHHNDGIYMDGDSSNSIFDLLNDIEDIRAILFQDSNPPLPPQMIYYSMPTVGIPTILENNNIPGAISAFGGGGNNISNVSTNPTNSNVYENQERGNTPALNGGITTGISPIDTFISTINNTDNETSIQPLGPISTIPASLCPTPNNILTNIPEPLATDISPIEQFTQVQGQLFDSLSGLLFQPPSNNDITNLNNLSNAIAGVNNNLDNRIQTEDPSPESLQCSNSCESKTDQIEKQICEGNCCISACNTINNLSKKAICISQCLCGEIATKNDELRIKFCKVPAQSTRVIANKSISNIEQAIDAINSIFRYLKNNGLMTKRTKTKELFDSSFSDIKLSQILSFDIFIAFKPLYDKISFSRLKESKQKENKATQQAIHPLGTTLGSSKDKSKYIVLGNHTKTQAQKNIYTSFNQFNDNVRDLMKMYCQQNGQIRIINADGLGECVSDALNKENITENAKNLLKLSTNEEAIAQVDDNIYKFIDQNYTFWEQIGQSINDMLTTSNTLKSKAENAQ